MFCFQIDQNPCLFHSFSPRNGHCVETSSCKYQTWSHVDVENFAKHRKSCRILERAAHAAIQRFPASTFRNRQKVFEISKLHHRFSIIHQYFLENYRFFIQVASDCETVDQTSHSMSFISDANVLALHRLLWSHQVCIYFRLNNLNFIL